ncbi:MAG: hypothetical protein ACLVJH_02215 [Faecalibacterium prausnitzii]
MTAIGVIVALIVAVVGVAAGYFIGYNNRKKTARSPDRQRRGRGYPAW